MEAKELFKKLVADAKRPIRNGVSIMSYGSQRASDFEGDPRGRCNGRFAHLTDEFIDGLDDVELEHEMVRFIYTCFQQR